MSTGSIIILVICTLLVSAFTWKYSIKANRLHGIPRFFAFESIIVLTLLNYNFWFVDPFSLCQLVSWILLIISIVFVVLGYFLLHSAGKPEGDLESTTVLVSFGLFKYIRHPLYASLLLLGTGIFLKNITILTVLFAVINAIALFATARREEEEMIDKFGEEYKMYMQKTKMFIPFLI